MAAESLQLPAILPSQQQLSRLVSSRQTDYSFHLGEKQGMLILDPGIHSFTPEYILHLSVDDQPLKLFMGHELLDHFLPEPLTHKAVKKLPKDLFNAAISHGFSPIRQPLQEATGLNIAMTRLEPAKAPPDKVCLTMTLNLGDSRHRLQLEAESFVLELLEQLPAYTSEQAPDIPIWAELFLGRSFLSRQEVNDLAMGDVVFVQQHVTGQQLAVRINGHSAFVCEADGNQITVRQRMNLMDEQEIEDQAPEESGKEHAGVDLSDMQVELLFELGRQHFTADEIHSMQPGYVFDLDRPIEQPVQIRANGKVIAECKLVQIENRLGAVITGLKD